MAKKKLDRDYLLLLIAQFIVTNDLSIKKEISRLLQEVANG